MRFEDRAHSFGEALGLLAQDHGFRETLIERLVSAPFKAFRFEAPPVTQTSLDQRFEFVLVQDDALERLADPSAFAEHFGDAEVVAFSNLGRDATLIVPRELGPRTAYAHLGAFVRGAPRAQQHALWQLTAQEALARMSERPLWLNTAGLGVPWLHVRLDQRPKYYRHAPYKVHAPR